jgi:hypothetical protein
MILFFVVKPTMTFDSQGNMKRFGLNEDETIYSVGVFTTVSAISVYYLFCIIDLIFE